MPIFMGVPAGIPDLAHFAAGFAKYSATHPGQAAVFFRENTECDISLAVSTQYIVSGDVILATSLSEDNYLNLSNYLIKTDECGIKTI